MLATPSPILEVVVFFLIVKVLFSFLRDEWMTELTVGEQLPSVETGWISSPKNCKTLSPAPTSLTPSLELVGESPRSPQQHVILLGGWKETVPHRE